MKDRLAGPRPQSYDVQAIKIQEVQEQLQVYVEKGYEIIQADESTFSANKHVAHAWAPRNKPLKTVGTWSNAKVLAVCGFISDTRGAVHYHFEDHSCNGESMVEAFTKVREKMGKDTKIVCFLDNARIHHSKLLKTAILPSGLNIELLFNLPYR